MGTRTAAVSCLASLCDRLRVSTATASNPHVSEIVALLDRSVGPVFLRLLQANDKLRPSSIRGLGHLIYASLASGEDLGKQSVWVSQGLDAITGALTEGHAKTRVRSLVGRSDTIHALCALWQPS